MTTTLSRSLHVLMIALLVALPATALEVEDGYVRGLPPGQPVTAAFFVLKNRSEQPWVLVAAASEVAERVEIHRHQMQGGVMRMRQQERVVVPAGSELVFAPGGYHLMLMGLRRALRDGELVQVVLQAENGERVEVALPVVSVLNEHRRDDDPDDSHHHH